MQHLTWLPGWLGWLTDSLLANGLPLTSHITHCICRRLDSSRARREGDASLTGSEASSLSSSSGGGGYSSSTGGGLGGFGDADAGFGSGGGGVLHGDSDRLSDIYFSYSAVTDSLGSPAKRPGTAGGGGGSGSPLAGRPRTAALAARQSLHRPFSAVGGAQAWG